MTRSLALALALVLVACSSSSSPSSSSSDPDAGGATPPGATDGGGDAPASSSCDATCQKNTLEAVFGGASGAFDHAHFGRDTGDGGATLLHLEAYGGGPLDCPTQTSPTPDRTFILAGTPVGSAGASYGDADGVKASFFDFKGDILTGAPVAKATTVTVKLVAIDDATLALDVQATFAGGTVNGHVYATYCASLSTP